MSRHLAYKHLAAAEEAFLRARGWVQTGHDSWVEPRLKEGVARTLCFGHAVNSEMIYSSHADVGPDEPPRMKEPDLEDIKLRASQEIYLRERGWRTFAPREFGELWPDPNGTLYCRKSQYLSFKEALDKSKYHDRKHGAHLAVKKLYEASRNLLNEIQPDTSQRTVRRDS